MKILPSHGQIVYMYAYMSSGGDARQLPIAQPINVFIILVYFSIRDWSLITGRGGGDSFGVILSWYLEVLAIMKEGGGGAKSFHPLKGGALKVLPCLRGGGAQNVSDLRCSHFVDPRPPK